VKAKSKTVDDYLASVPPSARDTLAKIRAVIKTTAPEEKISWGMPTFYHQGGLVGFAAFKNHCSMFVMSGTFLGQFRKELGRYETTKGTIHFPHDKPLPSTLVRKIVRARLAENAQKAEKRKRKL
jgi:uncharacterized protein YdhG (YjbR/CyaY superfamily)